MCKRKKVDCSTDVPMHKNLDNCQNIYISKNKNTAVVSYLKTQVFRPLAQSYYIIDWILRGPQG